MRKLTAFALSLVTVVGGHILNRRYDKALLFFSLFILATLLGFYAVPLLLLVPTDAQTYLLRDFPLAVPAIASGLLLLVALVSASASLFDTRETADRSPVTASAVMGSLFSLLIAGLIMAYVVHFLGISLSYAEQPGFTGEAGEADDSSPAESPDNVTSSLTYADAHFWHPVRYGLKWIDDAGLAILPAGDAYLVGRMTYGGLPARGVSLYGIFNGKYKSRTVTTNEKGEFAFRLPAGEWLLNRINTEEWSQRPVRGSFTLIGTANPTLSKAIYHAGPEHSATGILLTAGPRHRIDPQLEINISDTIRLTWPGGSGDPAALATGQIAWKAVPGAARYQVQLHHMERNGSTTTYTPVFWRNTEDSILPLADIRAAPTDSDSTNEYQVRVHAFDDGGRLLTSTPDFSSGDVFKLQGQEILSYRDFPNLGAAGQPDLDLEDMEKMQHEKRLISAAEVLAKEDMPDAARQLLQKIDTNYLAPRRDRLEGLILTAEGLCEQARTHFEMVKRKWKRDCVPDFYRKRCENTKVDRSAPQAPPQ